MTSIFGGIGTQVVQNDSPYYDAVLDAGADPSGLTDSTLALLAFYTVCITTHCTGYIPAGIYMITPGILRFQVTSTTGTPWPNILTAGYTATVFVNNPTTNVNAPFLELTSVTTPGDQGPTYSGSQYWFDGCHGGLTFKDTSNDNAPLRCGLALTGCWSVAFGYMCGYGLRGSTVTCPPAFATGGNPDPYATSYTTFEGIEGTLNIGLVVNNLNGIGQDSWDVDVVRGIQCQGGVWFGLGEGTRIRQFSTFGCLGRCIDDSFQTTGTGANRLIVEVAEFDGCQYGIRLNKMSDVLFKQVRFNTRFGTDAGPLNTSGLYWPLIALEFGGGTNTNVHNAVFEQMIYRVDSGGLQSQLGKVLEFHNDGNVNNIKIDFDLVDNPGFGLTPNFIVAGGNIPWGSTYGVKISLNGRPLFDDGDYGESAAAGSAATLILNSGYPTVAAKLGYVSQYVQTYSSPFDLGADQYTAIKEGLYLINISFNIGVAVGTRVRLAVRNITQNTVLCEATLYSANATTQTYQTTGFVKLLAGDVICAIADQNTGTASVPCIIPQAPADCRFMVLPYAGSQN